MSASAGSFPFRSRETRTGPSRTSPPTWPRLSPSTRFPPPTSTRSHPRSTLAPQTPSTLGAYQAPRRVRLLPLTGALSQRERREALEALLKGEIDLVVGTQALVQEDVRFARLGLVVIDEQHRFGVAQR